MFCTMQDYVYLGLGKPAGIRTSGQGKLWEGSEDSARNRLLVVSYAVSEVA